MRLFGAIYYIIIYMYVAGYPSRSRSECNSPHVEVLIDWFYWYLNALYLLFDFNILYKTQIDHLLDFSIFRQYVTFHVNFTRKIVENRLSPDHFELLYIQWYNM